MKKVCVLGLGYIGLPTSVVLAKSGFKVNGVDTNKEIVKGINNGISHINEPGLEKLIKKLVCVKKVLFASIKPSYADVFIVAVPTPFEKSNTIVPKPNISFVIDAVKSIIPYLKKDNLIILESTSPIGTTEKISEMIFKNTGFDSNQIFINYCPERVLPGAIIKELVENDRVIGGITKKSSIKCKDFYQTFCKGKINLTNSKTAELVKLTENAYRDVNIAFANELSLICDEIDINVRELISISNNHPRVNILQPSCGVGGHCIAVDPWFIADQFPSKTSLIQASRKINDNKKDWVVNKIKETINQFQKNKNREPVIGFMGISFKPNVEDTRESPALYIAQTISRHYKSVFICEPNLSIYKGLVLKNKKYILENCDLIVLLVAHKEFKCEDFEEKFVLDFCGITNN